MSLSSSGIILLLVWVCVSGKIYPLAINYELLGEEAPPGSPWPLPAVWKNSSTVLSLNPQLFRLESRDNLSANCDVIDEAFKRYTSLFFPPDDVPSGAYPNVSVLELLLVSITQPCARFPQYSEDPNDEEYTLDVVSSVATLNATTVWGALRGLETFAQLIWQTEDTNQFVINVTSIEDRPRFNYRGIMLDTARHFVGLETLLLNLDAMAANKMNVFHWHLVDDQSFPYESKVFPNLTQGAFTPRHVYTTSDISQVIEYARLRGIRVIPEFDTPGHTGGFGKAYRDILTPCYGDGVTAGTPNRPKHAEYQNLDPTRETTFEFLAQFFAEVRQTFPEKFVHLGLDEIRYGCWESSPVVADFMKENNLTNYDELVGYYIDRHFKTIEQLGFEVLAYEDPLDNGIQLPRSTIVEVWKDTSLDSSMWSWQTGMEMVTSSGYRAILSGCWYLNYIYYGQDWRNAYVCDPLDFTGGNKDLVVGGEAKLWAEYVDPTNLLSRLWPRASAAAERLWSVTVPADVDSAAFRIDQQRCRMLRRGIPAEPISPGYCGAWEVK